MNIVRTRQTEITPFITKDGSQVRELIHPKVHGNQRQSLAEAVVPPHGATHPHRHLKSEEIYHVLEGEGRLALAETAIVIAKGDSVYIPPRTVHSLVNLRSVPLRILCCCSPPYDHDDTVLADGGPPS